MHVDLDRETRIQNHFDRGVEIAEIFRAAIVAPRGVHHGLRIHAEPHMIEAGGLDQRDVGRTWSNLQNVLWCIPWDRKPARTIRSD